MELSNRLSKLLKKSHVLSLREKVVRKWRKLYIDNAKERFDKMSEGGGSWRPLKRATIERKIQLGQSKKILVATGQLRSDLDKIIKFSYGKRAAINNLQATISFSGGGSYGNGLRTSDVAKFHQSGGGKLPQRKILVRPSGKLYSDMLKAAKDAFSNI